ncbi:MAG: GntR family transcriptional regulator [Rhodothermaceae bacterium]|nr:GntR family transcriptional regulator [Rhodothermaceae bacterium]
MIELDRDAALPIAEQLIEQLRYHLAAGRYRTGERLPSTRALADQIGVSFHTVRKAYQRLEGENLLESRRGGGFYVAERPTLSAAERRERGATIVQEALQRLVALGLTEDETEYLFEEQRQFFESPGERRRVLVAATFKERAESLAEQLTGLLQERVEPVTVNDLGRYDDAAIVIAPFGLLQQTMHAIPDAEAVGLHVGLSHEVLERIARLGSTDTLGLVTRRTDAVEPITTELRHLAGFSGQVLALTIEGERRRLETLLVQVDLVVYTPQVRRRLRPLLTDTPHVELTPVVPPDSLARVRETVGR